MNKSIFLDRDGVINNNKDKRYIYRTKDLILNNGIIETLKAFSVHHFLLIIISNQSGIAKGIYSKYDCDCVNTHLKMLLSEYNIPITEVYYCPHHPDTGNCLCRKPESLLFEKAIARFAIDPAKSWMIGDSETDMTAAKKAGLKTIIIQPNEDIRKYLNKIITID